MCLFYRNNRFRFELMMKVAFIFLSLLLAHKANVTKGLPCTGIVKGYMYQYCTVTKECGRFKAFCNSDDNKWWMFHICADLVFVAIDYWNYAIPPCKTHLLQIPRYWHEHRPLKHKDDEDDVHVVIIFCEAVKLKAIWVPECSTEAVLCQLIQSPVGSTLFIFSFYAATHVESKIRDNEPSISWGVSYVDGTSLGEISDIRIPDYQ